MHVFEAFRPSGDGDRHDPGSRVRITAGPFKDFVGFVNKAGQPETLRVTVSLFGGDALVEVPLWQVEEL